MNLFEIKYNVHNDMKLKLCGIEIVHTFNQKYLSWTVYVRTFQKILFFKGKEANEIPWSQNNYLGFYTSEYIFIFWYILSKIYCSEVLIKNDVCVIRKYFIGQFPKKSIKSKITRQSPKVHKIENCLRHKFA